MRWDINACDASLYLSFGRNGSAPRRPADDDREGGAFSASRALLENDHSRVTRRPEAGGVAERVGSRRGDGDGDGDGEADGRLLYDHVGVPVADPPAAPAPPSLVSDPARGDALAAVPADGERGWRHRVTEKCSASRCCDRRASRIWRRALSSSWAGGGGRYDAYGS